MKSQYDPEFSSSLPVALYCIIRMLKLRGPGVLMLDGTIAHTEVISVADTIAMTEMGRDERDRAEHCLDMLLQKICERGDMVVGLDIESQFTETGGTLITLCSRFGCLLMKLAVRERVTGISLKLVPFLAHKDIIFAGVHLQEEVKRLREAYGLGIRNVVDLSELAADVLCQPRLRAFGVRSLAHEVLRVPFKPRPCSMISYRAGNHLTLEQIECASTDAYAAYKIGKTLLGA